MSRKTILLLILISPVLILVLVLYLLSTKNGETQTSEKTKVATTIYPVYDIASQIGGDKVEVVNILPTGASPHTYEPSISDRQEVDQAVKVFVIGQGLDHWVEDIADEKDIVDLSTKIDLIADEEEGENPHYWLDPENARIIAQEIRDQLIDLDPDNTNYYQNNENNFEDSMDELILASNLKLENLSTRKMITFHDAFSYFAERFDLQIVTTVEPFPGKEPTAQYIADVGTKIQEENLKVIYSEPQLSDSLVNSLASDYGIKVAILDPLGGVGGRMTYQQMIEYNVEIIMNSQ